MIKSLYKRRFDFQGQCFVLLLVFGLPQDSRKLDSQFHNMIIESGTGEGYGFVTDAHMIVNAMFPTNSLPLRISYQMKLFRQITSLFLALWVVTVSSGFTIHKHFCEGELKRIAILNEASPCEHAQPKAVEEPSCPMCKMKEQKTPKNDCCENEVSQLALEDTLTPAKVFMDFDKHFQFVALVHFIFSELYSDFPAYYKNYLNFKPPLVTQDIPVLVQSFLL